MGIQVYLDGEFVQGDEAKISVWDLGLLRGMAVFDYLRTYGGKPFLLDEHLRRFQQSAEMLGLSLPHSLPEIEGIVLELLGRSGFLEASVKLLATGGVSDDQMTPQSPARLCILAYPLAAYPRALYEKGVQVATTRMERLLPQCKSTMYAPAIAALKRVPQAFELVYVNRSGMLLEGATSNLFAVREGQLYTQLGDEVLPGVTRDCVLRLVEGRFPIDGRGIALEEVKTLDEMFLTASNKEILPVVKIDDTLIGNGQVGPITKKVMELYLQFATALLR